MSHSGADHERMLPSTDRDPAAVLPAGSDPAADLAERFGERLRLFALRRVRDAAAAEDVAQETLRRVADALRAGRVANLDALPGFVFQTGRHVCLERQRAAGREERALRRLGASTVEAAPAPDALAMLIGEERRVAVHRALSALDPDDRALLRQVYFDQLDSAQIAHRLGVTAGAFRVRKHRALRRLGALLGDADARNDLANPAT